MTPLERQLRQIGAAYRAALRLYKDGASHDVLYHKVCAVASEANVFLGLLPPEEPPKCQHPQEKRNDHSTPGTYRYQCGVCGELVEEAIT